MGRAAAGHHRREGGAGGFLCSSMRRLAAAAAVGGAGSSARSGSQCQAPPRFPAHMLQHAAQHVGAPEGDGGAQGGIGRHQHLALARQAGGDFWEQGRRALRAQLLADAAARGVGCGGRGGAGGVGLGKWRSAVLFFSLSHGSSDALKAAALHPQGCRITPPSQPPARLASQPASRHGTRLSSLPHATGPASGVASTTALYSTPQARAMSRLIRRCRRAACTSSAVLGTGWAHRLGGLGGCSTCSAACCPACCPAFSAAAV